MWHLRRGDLVEDNITGIQPVVCNGCGGRGVIVTGDKVHVCPLCSGSGRKYVSVQKRTYIKCSTTEPKITINGR